MGEVRNQLKSQSLEAVEPSSFQAVGGRVFPDAPSLEDQLDLRQIVNAWAAVHAPNYGQPIPQTGGTATKDGAGEVLEPSTNEVYRINYISLVNAGAAPIVCVPQIGSTPCASTEAGTVPPGETKIIMGPFMCDKQLPIAITVTSGTAADLTTTAVFIKVAQ